jgi:hypothetical protein
METNLRGICWIMQWSCSLFTALLYIFLLKSTRLLLFISFINIFRALKVFAVGDNLGAWVLNEKEGHALIPL